MGFQGELRVLPETLLLPLIADFRFVLNTVTISNKEDAQVKTIGMRKADPLLTRVFNSLLRPLKNDDLGV